MMEDHISDGPFGFDPEAEKEYMYDNGFWEECSDDTKDIDDEAEERDELLEDKDSEEP